jgi:hypothetical protein
MQDLDRALFSVCQKQIQDLELWLCLSYNVEYLLIEKGEKTLSCMLLEAGVFVMVVSFIITYH